MEMAMEKMTRFFIVIMFFSLIASGLVWADQDDLTVIEATKEQGAALDSGASNKLVRSSLGSTLAAFDPTKYTLGPDDVVEVTVMRHPEFSGTYPVNMEGKIQYKFVGDIEITGLTKKGLEDKIKGIISTYVINPEVNVNILEFRSKVIYVLGEVGAPGKYYMRSESIPVREAVVQAGLPTLAAAMRRCMLVTPDKGGNPKTRSVDLYSILYNGDLKKNIDMHPGEVLYIPSTVMAKIIRVINPITSAIGVSSSGPSEVSTAKSAFTTMGK